MILDLRGGVNEENFLDATVSSQEFVGELAKFSRLDILSYTSGSQ